MAPRRPVAAVKKKPRREYGDGDDDEIHRRAVEVLRDGRTLGDAELAELAALRKKAVRSPAAAPSSSSSSSYVSYPSLDDAAFGTKLLSKREFAEHVVAARAATATSRSAAAAAPEAAWSERCSSASSPSAFELTRPQLLVRNYMSPESPYNGVLLFHGVGVGKTCTAVTIAEQFADANRPVLVLTRPGLRDNFRRTVFDIGRVARRLDGSLDWDAPTQCTGTTYTDRVLDRRAITPEQVDAKVARAVRSRYAFMGLGEFANAVIQVVGTAKRRAEDGGEGEEDDLEDGSAADTVRSSLANDRLRLRFSNTVIVIDEAHNLRGGEENKRVTPALRRVLAVTDNVKLVLMTATPMFNRSSDLIDLVNLLLVNDKRPPLRVSDVFDRDGELTASGGADRLRAACRGYISFAPGGDPFSFPANVPPSVNRDAAVMKTVPTVDIKGEPIAPERRLRLGGAFELIASPMGRHQRLAYLGIETTVREASAAVEGDEEDGEGEDEDEDDGEGENAKRKPRSTALHAGMQTCNVVFPSNGSKPTDSAAFYGAFRRVGQGRPIQFEYRPGVPHFLERSSIDAYAPKIGAVVSRVSRSEGVVMVYSRFIWGGIVPLALALEHEGFSRFDASPMLRSDGGDVRGGQRRGAYAIISGDRDVRSGDDARVLAALTSTANRDGAIIKVVIVSDKGSEGIDLKYVREVHVLEPWYHLNKIQQVVGRASRMCSHAELPLGKRNLTVFLHAATRPEQRPRRGGGGGGGGDDSTWGPANAETIDLRAYRLAQLKQGRIDRVEAILRSVAIDCQMHARSDARGADARMADDAKSTTSQRTAFRQRSPQNNTQTRCDAWVAPGDAKDDSTYDPGMHAYYGGTYRRLISSFFSDTTRVSASFDDLWQHVRSGYKMGGEPDVDRFSAELDGLIRTGRTVTGPRADRPGRIVHRGARYLFQPADEDTTDVLTDWERGTRMRYKPIVTDARQMFMSPPPHVDAQQQQQQQQQPQQQQQQQQQQKKQLQQLQHDRRADRAAADLEALADDAAALMARIRLPPSSPYHAAALDAVVDRLPHARMLRLAGACVLPEEAARVLPARLRSLRARARASMQGAGVLSRAGEFYSPYQPGTVVCIDRSTGDAGPCRSGARAHYDASPPLPDGVVGAIVALPREGRAVFKVLDVALAAGGRKRGEPQLRLADGGRGSGCVCYQSSVLTSERLQQIIAEESGGAKFDHNNDRDKRTLCELYEVVLRRHRPRAILRVGWRNRLSNN